MTLLLAACLSVFISPASAAAPKYTHAVHGDVAFDEPEGWTISEFPQQMEISVYFGSKWFDAIPRTSGWAHILIRSFPLEDFGPSRYARATQEPGQPCEALALRSLQDYRNEVDCGKYQACRPCAAKKCPRSPIGGTCGRYTKVVSVGADKGYYYRMQFSANDPDLSSSPEFNRAYREVAVILAPTGAKKVYIVEFHAPANEFMRHEAVFLHVLKSIKDQH